MFTVTIVVQMVELLLGRCDNKLYRPIQSLEFVKKNVKTYLFRIAY
jgi:hypothetical protein